MELELKDTIKMMVSPDYKERFKAEFFQLAIRREKLLAIIEKYDRGELDFIPSCTRELYNFQLKAMEDYLYSLDIWAKREGLDYIITKE